MTGLSTFERGRMAKVTVAQPTNRSDKALAVRAPGLRGVRRILIAAMAATVAVLAFAASAGAELAPFFSDSGKISLSVDAIGTSIRDS